MTIVDKAGLATLVDDHDRDGFRRSVLLDEADARVTAFAGTGTQVLVRMSSGHPQNRPDEELIAKRAWNFSDGGRRHVLAVEDLNWTWMSRPGLIARVTDAIAGYVKDVSAGFVVGSGSSAGASNLMDMCARVRFDAQFLISPQIDLGAAFRGFDPRQSAWMNWVQDDARLPRPANAFQSDTQLVILHGLRGADAAHAAVCPATTALHHYLFPDMGHSLAQRLKPERRLKRVVDCLFDNDLPGVERILIDAGALRRGSSDYQSPAQGWEPCPESGQPKSPMIEGHSVAGF